MTRQTLREAGLDGVVEIREGDALRTLADLDEEIGVLLLDGWKDLCLPVLAMLEPQLTPGALVLADDTDQDAMTDYLAYVRDPAKFAALYSHPAVLEYVVGIFIAGIKKAARGIFD